MADAAILAKKSARRLARHIIGETNAPLEQRTDPMELAGMCEGIQVT